MAPPAAAAAANASHQSQRSIKGPCHRDDSVAFAKLQSRAGQARANARCAADEGGRCRNAALPHTAATGRIDQQPTMRTAAAPRGHTPAPSQPPDASNTQRGLHFLRTREIFYPFFCARKTKSRKEGSRRKVKLEKQE